MTTTPLEVTNRPFSVEPITGVMLPDGIFDSAIFEQNITCFFTNTGADDLTDVTIYFEGISDPAISVTATTHAFARIPAGASVQVAWLGNFKNANPGKKNISLIAKSPGLSLQRQIKQIFVTRTAFDPATKTYTCEFPEGTMRVKFRNVIKEKSPCRPDKEDAPLWIPVSMEMGMAPNPAYRGQFGDLPFQDPWWKIVALIVAALAAIGAAIAAALGSGKASVGASGGFDETTGEVSCCRPADGLSPKERLTVAGALSTVATGALVVAASDYEDPWYRGQKATLPGAGELTLSEQVDLTITYSQPPNAGQPYKVQVDWTYTRVTDQNSYPYSVSEEQTNLHTLGKLVVDAPSPIQAFQDPFTFGCQFIREDGTPFMGSQLYAYALVVSPKKVAFRIPLLDDGIDLDRGTNDGIYTAHLDWREAYREHVRYLKEGRGEEELLGVWLIYIYAQDINDATPAMKPTEAATHIGGMMIASASALTFDSTLPCPLKANAKILVT